MLTARTTRVFLLVFALFVALFTVGGLMNQVVVRANGGLMPVEGPECRDYPGMLLDGRHICADANTKFAFLDDRYPTPDHLFIMSLGDAALIAGHYGLMATLFVLALNSIFLFAIRMKRRRI